MSDKLPVKIAALDEDDLAVISALAQDAILRVGDIRWLKPQSKLALVANRFDHSSGNSGERRHCGLQISRVSKVSSRNINMSDATAVLSLLAISFETDATPPAGHVELIFAGGGVLRADVECIEVAISDLSGPWPAVARPDHDKPDALAGDAKA